MFRAMLVFILFSESILKQVPSTTGETVQKCPMIHYKMEMGKGDGR